MVATRRFGPTLRPHARTRTRLGILLSAVSAVGIAVATLTPSAQPVVFGPWCLVCGTFGTVDVLLNVVLFMPLGIGLGLAGVRPLHALVLVALLSLTIEALQLVVVAGRDASLSDLFTNTVGGLLGAVIGGALDHVVEPSPAFFPKLTSAWAAFLIVVHTIAALAALPSPTRPPYFGHVGRPLGGLPGYPGRIVSIAIGGEPIPDRRFGGRQLHEMLADRDGAPVDAVVVPNAVPPWRASIVRVVDRRGHENVMLAQDGDALVFGVRTMASSMRLRPFQVRLPGVFSPTGGDSVRVYARASRFGTTLRAGSERGSLGVVAGATPGQAWRLVMPFPTYLRGGWRDRVLGGLWVWGLVLPLGAFSTAAARMASRARTQWRIAVPVTAVFLAFAAPPLVLGTLPPTFFEWLGSAAGLLTGGVIGSRWASIVGRTRRRDTASRDD